MSVSDAREGRSETKIDQENIEAGKKIIEYLLGGGYFRARVAGLSDFDKIIGGLAWSITASNVDVDIDILFQEEAQIGQKIKLSEVIVEALKRMNCPYRLEPYQIQGVYNTDILPVIQWLIKKVIETREETGDLLRIFTETQFEKTYKHPTDVERDQVLPKVLEFNSVVTSRYRPVRKLRRAVGGAGEDEETRVQSALLEYGHLYRLNRSAFQDEKRKREEMKGGESSEEKYEAAKREEERRLAEMRKRMGVAGGGVSGSIVGGLLAEQSRAIAELSQGGVDQVDGLTDEQRKRVSGAEAHRQNVQRLQKQIDTQKQQIAELEGTHQGMQAKLRELQEEYNKRLKINQRAEAEIAKLRAMETPENAAQLAMLKSLVSLNEELRKQEEDFRAYCKAQRDKLSKLLADSQASGLDPEEEKRLKMIEAMYAEAQAKLEEAKRHLAKKTRDIALVRRKIDEVPSRTELQQYQKQFVELYEQVAAKFTETRQYYSSYNTLNDTLTFLSKEVSILKSIDENYQAAMSSKSNREKLLENMETIIKSVAQNLSKVETKLTEEKARRDKLNDTYLQLVEKERAYYAATKEFEEECRKNEQLLQRLGK